MPAISSRPGRLTCSMFPLPLPFHFQPRLWGKPVVVLSNNDGCVIARSPEAKALGHPDGRAGLPVAGAFPGEPRRGVQQQLRALRRHEPPGHAGAPAPRRGRRGLQHRRGVPEPGRHGDLPDAKRTPATSATRCGSGPASPSASAWRPRRRWPSWRTGRRRKRAACTCSTTTSAGRAGAARRLARARPVGRGRAAGGAVGAAGHPHGRDTRPGQAADAAPEVRRGGRAHGAGA